MTSSTLACAPLLARRELWMLVSVAYVDPYHRQRLEVLSDPGFRQRTLDATALLAQESSSTELGPGEIDPKTLSPKALFDAFENQHEALEATYRNLFGLTAVSQRCPPCEVEFEPNTDITYRSQRMADVGAFYQAFGLQVSTRAGERLDHVTVQAEFLYLLLAKEAAARQAGNEEGAEVCHDARRQFFQTHVGWWLPAFSRVLSRVAPQGYYRRLASVTAGISTIERISLGLPPFRARIIPKPSGMEPEAACFDCIGRPQTP